MRVREARQGAIHFEHVADGDDAKEVEHIPVRPVTPCHGHLATLVHDLGAHLLGVAHKEVGAHLDMLNQRVVAQAVQGFS